jgi:DNA-binding NarL/FixJ family response regulator
MAHDDRRVEVIYNVLVVDDYEPWRRYVCAEVRKHARWCVIDEASDGLEAVRMAHALEPDLIVLDIGLPAINGIEAARRILAQRPDSRILFLTEQHSADIAEAALEAGARGYLLKVDAGRDLLFAMEAVVNFGQFVSSGLMRPVAASPRGEHWHEAAFYSDEASILNEYTSLAEVALADGNTFIFVSDQFRRNALQQRLQERGFDVERLVAEGRYVLLDVERILSETVVDGVVDEAAFRQRAVPLMARAESTSRGRVTACGDCCGTLWRDGHVDAAVRLERLWDELARERQFDLFCGYLVDVPRLADDKYALFQSICREHSLVHVR